ncbi:COG1361 S-layer family protein [Aeromicrobium sp.]|uniref:COG1361 S-layer family protein n=1 Tax=Aeromicrobium sp. TaxID=1871063 RepID=UPI002FC7C211
MTHRRLRPLLGGLAAGSLVMALAGVAPAIAVAERGDPSDPPKVGAAVKAGKSKPVRDLSRGKPVKSSGGLTTDKAPALTSTGGTEDAALDEGDAPVNDDLSAPLQNFAGQTSPFGPADTVGDVGPNHYVQMINSNFQIYNKDGTTAAGGASVAINSLWTSNNVNDNGCDTQNAGDPIVLYDQTADRWMLSQFTSPNTAPFDMCIAYSQTPDPTGAYFTYSFRLPASHDYMKYAIWPDGLYMSTFEGGTLGAYVFDRSAMLSGSPATFQYFGSGAGALGPGVSSAGRVRLFPSDWDGSNPPAAGEPNHFLLSKDADNGQGGTQDTLEIYDFHVDWNDPANSTFGLATTLNTAPYDIDVGCVDGDGDGQVRGCVDQPNSTRDVDSLPGRLMHRVQYRNFGTHRSMVVVQSSVDADGNDRVGTRWYELRNSGAGWTIHQQGTYAPAATPGFANIGSPDRWMGSIAMDKDNNIAIGYSIMDAPNNLNASIAYTGRLAGAPLGSMPEQEQMLLTSNAVHASERWGDYSSMNVDPTDDCTFWYTTMVGGSATQIGSFRFSSCTSADLRITKSDTPDPVAAGEDLTYTINVTNAGPNTAEDVTVTDVLPAGVTFLNSAPDCTNAGGTLTCAMGDLLAGQTVPLVIQVEVPADFAGNTLVNTATVSSPTSFDPDQSNNKATATTTVKRQADLAVTKVCKPDTSAPAGTEAFCDIHVDNLGPSDAKDVQLTDVLTSATPFELVSVTASPSGTCAPTSSGAVTTVTVTCDLGTEPAGGRTTVRVTVTADDAAEVNDVASVASSTTDPNTGNNRATGRVDFVGSADLSLDKTGPAEVVAGTELTYEIEVSNDGPSTARDVVVQDLLPLGVSFVSVTPSQGTCAHGQPGPRDVTCGLGNLAPGGSATITIVASVAPDVPPGTILFNKAMVSSSTGDPDNDDVRDSVPTHVVASADVSVTKTDSPDPVVAGNKLTYTITATNGGPSTAQNVTLVDTLPSGTTFVSGVNGQDVPVCTPVEAGKVVCSLGNLDPGKSAVVHLTVLVGANVPHGTVLENTVTVHADTPDPDPSDNTATASTAVTTSAELWLDKQAVHRTGNPAPTLIYTLVVHNDKGCEADAQSTPSPTCGAGGPSDAQNVQVVDILPLTSKKLVVQYVSPDCTYNKVAHKVTCSSASVPAGATVTYVIEAQIQGSVGEIANTATVSSSTADPVPGNNTDTATVVVKGGTGKGKGS